MYPRVTLDRRARQLARRYFGEVIQLESLLLE